MLSPLSKKPAIVATIKFGLPTKLTLRTSGCRKTTTVEKPNREPAPGVLHIYAAAAIGTSAINLISPRNVQRIEPFEIRRGGKGISLRVVVHVLTLLHCVLGTFWTLFKFFGKTLKKSRS